MKDYAPTSPFLRYFRLTISFFQAIDILRLSPPQARYHDYRKQNTFRRRLLFPMKTYRHYFASSIDDFALANGENCLVLTSSRAARVEMPEMAASFTLRVMSR